MGMIHFSCSSSTKTAPNPNPKRFTIKYSKQVGEYCLLRLNYPDCTTFGGDKVLVIKGLKKDILSLKKIDPHFLENGLDIIARFPATDSGISDAYNFIKMKNDQ